MSSTTTPSSVRPRAPRRSLYRTVLSLAVAAVVAATIPFAAIYGKALQSRPAYVASVPAATAGRTTTRLVTTASGRTLSQTVPAGAANAPAASVPAVAPLASRSS